MDAPINPSGRPFSPRLANGGSTGASDPFDALADLFLGPARAPEATSPAPLRLVSDRRPKPAEAVAPEPDDIPSSGVPLERASHDVPVEGLVLGHLPVFASAWATQYAKHVAHTTERPVALLRFTGGRASLDVYGVGRDMSGTGVRTLDDLARAIDAAAGVGPRWVVRLPDACEPELAEGVVESVTLLSGADEAAVVACYRTLKTLSSVERGEEARAPAWRVAIMGVDPIRALEAGKRVERAAAAFLDSSLEIAPCVARIGALKSTLLFEGPTGITWRDAIRLVRSSGVRAHTQLEATPPRIEPRPIASEPSHIQPRPASAPANSGYPSQVLRSTPPSASTTAASQASAEIPASPQVSPSIPGLKPSQARCPYAPGVEFATDDRGGLHLISRESGDISVRSLMTASSWAAAHASLLSMADPAIRSTATATLHLMTRNPGAERRLLDTSIRVHGVAQAGAGWVVMDLN